MDPSTLAIASIGSSIIGTGVQAIGAANSADAARQNAAYQAAVARNNQIIAEQNADYAAKAGASAVTRQQLRERDRVSGITAALGASGFDVNTGSPAKVRSSASEIGQLDVENEAQKAALNVYGFRSQATNYGAQAGLYRQEADQASTAGLFSAGGSLLSGFGSLSSKWAPLLNSSSDLGDWSARGSI